MLQKISDSLKGRKVLAYLLLFPLAAVFALWGAVGIVNMDLFGVTTWAAKADGEKVAVNDIQEAWRERQSEWQQRFSSDIPDALKAQAQDELLEQYVRDALLAKRTREFGYRVSQQRVRGAIEGLAAFQIDGKFNAMVAKAALAQRGTAEAKFETEIRSDLQKRELERALAVSEFRTAGELDRMLGLEDEQREVQIATLPQARFAPANIDASAVEAWYNAHVADYMQPESAQLQFAELRLEQVASSAAVAEQDLKDYYAKNRDRYVDPEKRRARHILINIVGGDDAAALKKAQSVLAEARAGKDFAELARQYSQDGGSAKQGGDLGWAERSAFVGPFSDALFSMSANEIRGPVKSEFGYHIIRLDGVQGGKSRSFEEARAEIASEVRKNKAADDFGSRYELVQRELEKPGADLVTTAKLAGMSVSEVPDFQRGVGAAPLGNDAALQDVVFGDAVLNQKKIGGPVNLGQDRFVIVRAVAHRKAAAKPLASVRDAVVTAVRAQKATAAALAAAELAKSRLAAGESIEKVAAQSGAKLEPARFVGRADPAMAAKVREIVFAGLRPQAGTPHYYAIALEQGGAAIVAVTAAKLAVDRSNAQLLSQRANQQLQSAGTAAIGAYVQEMRRSADVTKNPKAFE